MDLISKYLGMYAIQDCSGYCSVMKAFELVRLFVNRAVVSAEPKKRGNLGYGLVKALGFSSTLGSRDWRTTRV
jgi:hypothetical protein